MVHQVISIVCLLALFCMKDKYPTNMMLLALWYVQKIKCCIFLMQQILEMSTLTRRCQH